MSGSTARNFGGARHCVASATGDPRCWLAPQLTVIVHTVVGRIQRQCQIPVAAVYLLGYLAWSRAEPSRRRFRCRPERLASSGGDHPSIMVATVDTNILSRRDEDGDR